MSLIRPILNSLLTLLLAIFLPLNSYASSTQGPAINIKAELIMKLNSQKFDTKSVISALEEVDPKKAIEFSTWSAKFPKDINIVPKFYLEDEVIKVKIKEMLLTLNILENDELEIGLGDKKTIIDLKTSLVQIEEKLIRELDFSHNSSFSFLNIFMESAFAVPQTLAAILFLTGMALLVWILVDAIKNPQEKYRFEKMAKDIKLCESLNLVPVETLLTAEISAHYERTELLYSKFCITGLKKSLTSQTLENCKKVNELRECIKVKLNEVKSLKINGTSRKNVKENQGPSKKLDDTIPNGKSIVK